MSRRLLPLLLVALVAAACSSVASSAPPAPARPTTIPASPGPTESEPATPITASWAAGAERVQIDEEWAVRDCEGDALLLCVERGGEVAGTLYLDSFPLTDELAAARDETERVAALRAFAESRDEGIEQNRRETCVVPYDFQAEPVADITMAGAPGVRYGFSGTQDGKLTEYVQSYASVAAGQLWITVAEGASDGGCMGDAELDLFEPAALRDFLPLLDRVVAGTPLPAAGTRLEDGTVIGVDGGLEGGLLYVVIDHQKHRIQQPRPMTSADVEAEGLEVGPATVRVARARERTGSFFAVIPPDGRQAQLHLVVGGAAYPIVVQHLESWVVEGLREADRPVLDDLRPA